MTLRFAIFGTGFWSRFQLAAWHEVGDVECVALYNRTRTKAEALAHDFGVPRVYDQAEALLDNEQLDFIDIITDVDTHSTFVHMAAERQLPVICQKPMAASLEVAEGMVTATRSAGVPYFIHENWRWQTPLRAFKRLLDEGHIGKPFRGRIHYANSFPVFDNQPFLKDLEQFILTDIGSHILDTARFLFGEASTLYCQTNRIHTDIKGEDVATVMMTMDAGMTVVCEMSYASRTRIERFPETFVYVEGDAGYLELGPDYEIHLTNADGTFSKRYPPPHYRWADPMYDLVHASIVPCNADLLRALRGEGTAETTGTDNLKTMRLVYGAYESAKTSQVLRF
jgi:predicted dehydrogenase